METVFRELTLGCQQRFNSLRRKTQFFSTFAGGVVEALRESGFRLSNFRRQSPYTGENNIGLEFEQRDRDRCEVLIIPYRTDLPFLAKGKYYCQIGLELSRYSNDADVLRQALDANSRNRAGTFLGGSRLPKLTLSSPPALQRPGTMTFELQGARLVVAMNVIMDLAKYRQSDFDLDINAIRDDFQALFYGLEKYLSLLLKAMGGDVEVEAEEPASHEPPPAPAEPPVAEPPTSSTVPLQHDAPPIPPSRQASTMKLSQAELEAQTEREIQKDTLRVTSDQVQSQLDQIDDVSSTMKMSSEEVQRKLAQMADEDTSSTIALSADDVQRQISAIDSGKHRTPFSSDDD